MSEGLGTVERVRLSPSTEATFVAGHHGRDGVLLLWDDVGDGGDGGHERSGQAEILTAEGLRTVRADSVPVARSVSSLATLAASADVRSSVRAWSVATRLALAAVARGRILPSVAPDGADQWRVGPFDLADQERLEQLADALPPAAHATPVAGVEGLRMTAPLVAAREFLDAVADAFVRTGAAPLAAGGDAFAARHVTDVTGVESWLQSVVAGTAGQTAPGLRVELPSHDDGQVVCVLQVQSRLDPSLVLDAAQLWRAPAAIADRFGGDVETEVLLALRSAARVWEPVGRLLEEARPELLVLDDREVEDLFGPVADDLAAAGLPVLWPAEVFEPVDVHPRLEAPWVDERDLDDEQHRRSSLDLQTLGEMRWYATIDGTDLSEAELLQLAHAKRPVVRLRGRWVRADPSRLARLQERTPLDIGDVLDAALSGTVHIDGRIVPAEIDGPLRQLAHRLDTIDTVQARSAPEGVHATLRPYQERGLAWLAEMADLGLGGVLADDMGLGKTIQVLALHQHRKNEGIGGPTLVVCPATLMGNWEREAARFTPGIPVRRYHGAARSLDGLAPDEIVVATYGIVRRDADALAERRWDLVVADEAQAVKNPRARTARALRLVPAGARFALTGTPVENRLADLWALLDWTTPGLLGTLDSFKRTVATPIEREQDPEATAHLATLVRPFLLRRRKSDPEIAPDLPPKTETDLFVGLTVEQATLYKAVVMELLDEVAGSAGIDRRGQILKLLTALKQICNHPAQYLGQEGPLAGRSGKLAAATDVIETILDEGESVLVFTQYVAMGKILTRHLTERAVSTQFLHGGTPVAQRETMVDIFQSGSPMVFVISLKAGGTGLNLTRATHVIHYDRWWNPAVEDQASDRAWRIGQDRAVQVHRLVCEGTLEERIAGMLEHKRVLAEAVVGGGESWISELSDDELTDLVSLGIEHQEFPDR